MVSLPKENLLQALHLFGFEINVPIIAVDDSVVKTAKKHGGMNLSRASLALILTKNNSKKVFKLEVPSLAFSLVQETRDQRVPGSLILETLRTRLQSNYIVANFGSSSCTCTP